MRDNKWLLVTALVSVLVVSPLLRVHAAEIELNSATFFPPTHIHAKLLDSWGKEIEKRTDGKVKITYFPGGALLKGPQIYDGIVKGIADIGFSVFAYTRGRFPAIAAVELPLGYPSGKAATYTINDFVKKFKPKELDGAKVLFLHAHGPGLIHSKKPIYTLEDLKGLKLRTGGAIAKVGKALGAAPVAMGQGGTYEALQKGVVDATIAPIEVLKGWKHGEVTKYTTECYSVGYTSGFYVMMNLKKWNSLPKDVQKVFDKVSAEYVAKYAEAWDAIDKEGREFALGLGHKIIPLSKEESARWAKAVEPVIDDYIKETEAKGLPGEKYVKYVKNLIKKYSKK
jgi:TRAP-type C4-dicarboxylate transport system substrate-binding protein